MELKNKVAVVTGGSKGIGKASVVGLAEQGCKVVFCGRDKKNLEQAEKEFREKDIDVSGFLCDLSKQDEVKKFADFVVKRFGKVDILVNNAGVAYYQNLVEMGAEKIVETIDVNIKGLILLTKYLIPKINQGGLIINISSGAGKTGYAGLATYCASKFAVLGFTESLSGELKGVKVVAVCPGGVNTDMYMSLDETRHPSLKPEHIAAKILEICTEPKKFKSGEAVEVYHVTDLLNHLRLKYFRK